MKHGKSILLGFALLLLLTSTAFSQDSTPQPCPDVPSGALGCEPVEWSRLQDPVPIPDPNDEKPAPPDQQPDPRSGQSPNVGAEHQGPIRTFTGIVISQGQKYVLKVGEATAYQLDDQNQAKQYENKEVKVIGRLDGDSNILHIRSIALFS
jgi:hypothetical protein